MTIVRKLWCSIKPFWLKRSSKNAGWNKSISLRTRKRKKSHAKCSSSIIPKQCVHVRLKCVVWDRHKVLLTDPAFRSSFFQWMQHIILSWKCSPFWIPCWVRLDFVRHVRLSFNDWVLWAPDINQHLFVFGVWTSLAARTRDISSVA